MSKPPTTQAERLIRIETMLEQAVTQRAEDRDAMRQTIDKMASDIEAMRQDMTAGFKEVRKELTDDKADLASLKNKGAGLLIGAAVAGGAGWEAVRAILGSVFK